MRNRFNRFNQPVKCRTCGKMTTDVVNGCRGLALCSKCMNIADLENEHADGYHADAPHADCKDCLARNVQGK